MGENTGKWVAAVVLTAFMILGLEIKEIQDNADLQCPEVVKVNISDYEWNSYDDTVLRLAQVRCGFKYKHSPCLVKFTKTGMKDYRVLCGEKR